jgi:hypothetical protein
MPTVKKLLFVDANIWLDFYRTRTDAGMSLLARLDSMSDRIIVTYQLEMEVKKNRQSAMIEGVQELKPLQNVSRPALFSDAAAVRSLKSNIDKADASIKKLKTRLMKALENPALYDPVYKVYQRVFHKTDGLVLARDNPIRRIIRRRAFRRFIHGCPPRKKNDTSIGDAINWEWMIECATAHTAELVIVSRDSDYGVMHDKISYINDHLRQEFSDRVSRKRKLLLYTRLSEALEHFNVEVTEAERKEEEHIALSGHAVAQASTHSTLTSSDLADLLKKFDVPDIFGAEDPR